MRKRGINLPPFVCEVCNKPRSKARGRIHAECSKILQQIRQAKDAKK